MALQLKSECVNSAAREPAERPVSNWARFVLTVPIGEAGWRPQGPFSALPGTRRVGSLRTQAYRLAALSNLSRMCAPDSPDGRVLSWSVVTDMGSGLGVLTVSSAFVPASPFDLPPGVELFHLDSQEYRAMMVLRNTKDFKAGRWTIRVRPIRQVPVQKVGDGINPRCSDWLASVDAALFGIVPTKVVARPAKPHSEPEAVPAVDERTDSQSVPWPVRRYRLGHVGADGRILSAGPILEQSAAIEALSRNAGCVLVPVA